MDATPSRHASHCAAIPSTMTKWQCRRRIGGFQRVPPRTAGRLRHRTSLSRVLQEARGGATRRPHPGPRSRWAAFRPTNVIDFTASSRLEPVPGQGVPVTENPEPDDNVSCPRRSPVPLPGRPLDAMSPPHADRSPARF
jgi:hypothetical protein